VQIALTPEQYNEPYDTVVSVDANSMLEYWRPVRTALLVF
jgi:hypothetical protein